jgi:uncharacterized protein YigA (DUF484 family)
MAAGIMARVISEIETGEAGAHELEPYRRLIELQKEIIRLAQQNERARQKCVALRNHMATAGSGQVVAQRTLRQKMNKAFGQLPAFPAKSQLAALIIKEQATC